jgi:hypothetical protein
MAKEACPLFVFTPKEDHMITGEITVSTCYGNAVIPVEIFAKGPRPDTVWVRALNNLEPFTKMSHGGPYQDDTAVWSIPLVRNVQVAAETQPGAEEEQPVEVELPPVERPQLAPDWFLEMACEDRTYLE